MQVPQIDVAELELVMNGGAVVVDVREPDEYAEARIPGVRLVSMATVPDRLDELRGPAPVYVVCATGGRSARVVQFLVANGVDAVNVAGGTVAWIESGRGYDSDGGGSC